MKKLKTAILAITMMLSIAFVGESISTTSNNPFSAAAQTVTVRRTGRGIARNTYRGGRWVVRKTWNGTKWVYRRVFVPTGRATWRGTKKVGRAIKRAVY